MSPYRTSGPVTPSADALALDDLRCYCGCRLKAHTVDAATNAVTTVHSDSDPGDEHEGNGAVDHACDYCGAALPIGAAA